MEKVYKSEENVKLGKFQCVGLIKLRQSLQSVPLKALLCQKKFIIIIFNAQQLEKREKLRSPMHRLHVKDCQCTYLAIQSSIDGCSHEFCLRCIKKWARVKLFLFRQRTIARFVGNDSSKSRAKTRLFKWSQYRRECEHLGLLPKLLPHNRGTYSTCQC